MKIVEKKCRNSSKNSKKFDEFLRVSWIRSGAKVCESCRSWKNLMLKMTIWLEKSASIQKRTSPLKFDHFRYPKPDFTASNLSTKAARARRTRSCSTACSRRSFARRPRLRPSRRRRSRRGCGSRPLLKDPINKIRYSLAKMIKL